MSINQVREILSQHRDAKRSASAVKYLRNLFDCFGIPVGRLDELLKPIQGKKVSEIDWDFVSECYKQDEREMQYVANGHLWKNKKLLVAKDLPKVMAIAKQKSWWDTVDGLAGLVGEIVARDESQKQTMLEWSEHEDFWIRRIAILHQLYFRDKTDTELLATIIANNFGEKERSSPSADDKNQEQNRAFFINKAIGWALREYSKTNPQWVRHFIDDNRGKLSKLSIREGSKRLPKEDNS